MQLSVLRLVKGDCFAEFVSININLLNKLLIMRGVIGCQIRLPRLFVVVLMLSLNIIEKAGYINIVKVEEFSVKRDKSIGCLFFLLYKLIKFSKVAVTIQLT